MRSWALFLGGLLVWAADFFLLYAIASLFLTSPLARVLSGVVTVAALIAAAWLLLLAWRTYPAANDPLQRWMICLSGLMAALAMVATLWQGLPAILA